jgi:hypothetical protein
VLLVRVAGSRLPQAVKPAAVVGKGDQGPLGADLGEAAEVEAGEAEDGLDDAEDGFDGLLAVGVAGFGAVPQDMV